MKVLWGLVLQGLKGWDLGCFVGLFRVEVHGS